MDIKIIDFSNPLWIETLQKIRHDIYHLPEYFYLEAKRTNSTPQAIIITEDENILFFPYLLRHCHDLFDGYLETADYYDLTSAYGYSGFLLSDNAKNIPTFTKNAIDELKKVLKSHNVCSGFLCFHTILNQGLEEILSSDIYQEKGVTVSVNLELSEEEIWSQTRSEHRNHINRCKRAGLNAHVVPFNESRIDDFIGIYYETMERVEAKNSYFFDYEYFTDLTKLGSKIHFGFVELDQKIACVGIFTECCEIVQYHLGGTNSEFLKQAPTKLMFDYVRLWAKKRGNKVFHIGGGLGAAKDSLYNFKAGFSKERHPFFTLRLIVDEEKYQHLVDLRAKILNTEPETLLKSDFFPAYRASV